MKKDMYKDCRERAQEIEELAAGDVYNFEGKRVTLYDDSDVEEVQYIDEYGYIQTIGAEIWERDAEPVSICDWMCDGGALDYDFIVGPSHEYRAARICLTAGGPYVEVDTERRAVVMYWGGERTEATISDEAANAIDDTMANLWACGC